MKLNKSNKTRGGSMLIRKCVFMLASILFCFSTANAKTDMYKNLDQGTSEFNMKYDDMTPAGIQKLIREEIKTECEDGLCKIYGIETETKPYWELSFHAGQGNNNGVGNGTVYYIGGNTGSNSDSSYVGMSLTVRGTVTCQTTVKVDPSVFRLIKSYMYNDIKNDGRVARDLTDAEKTVLMFYGKIIEKVSSCQNAR